eukprot:PhM_4_TR8753/c0_g2_i2/m.93505/K01174/nuc; micrococcal nuclease
MGCKSSKERPQPSSDNESDKKSPEATKNAPKPSASAGSLKTVGSADTATEPPTVKGTMKSETIHADAEATAVTTQFQTQDMTDDTESLRINNNVFSMIPTTAEKVQCHHVYDGDTLTLMDQRRVRFLGIDTPELKEKQPFAEEAKAFTVAMCPKGATIWIDIDNEPEDHYGRLLRYVYVEDPNGAGVKLVNYEILRAGLARWYHPGDKKLRFEPELRAAMAEARRNRVGQWASFDSSRAVVATSRGKAYHIESCQHLKEIKHLRKMTEGEALDEGLSACRSCLDS